MPIPKAIRITGYFLISFISIFVIIGIVLNVYFNKKLIENIKERVAESTHNEYSLSLDGLSINLLTNTITLKNLIIAPSQKGGNKKAQYVFKAKTLKIINFSILSYLKKHDLLIDKIEFQDPQISIFQGSERLLVKKNQPETPFSLYQAFAKKLNSISIGNIDIMNSKFNIYRNGTDTSSIFSTNDNSVSIKNFIVNYETDKKERLFVADKFEIVMNKFSYHLGSGLYTIYGKSLYASYLDSVLIVDSLQVIPNFSKKEFADSAGRQISRVKIISSKINCKKMDVKLFFEYNWLLINKMDVYGCAIDIYRDNTLPLKPIVRPSLQTMLKDLPFLVRVDTIEMKEGDLVYQEINPDQFTSGELTINKMSAVAYGVQNDTQSYTDNTMIKIKINGLLLGQGNFTENYTFPLKTKEEIFYCSGGLTSMPLMSFNPLIPHSKNVQVKKGQLDSASFSFVAYENSSAGTMKFLYHDLEVEIKNKEGEKSGLKEKIKTILANKLIVKDSNPGKDGRVRISKIYAQHNRYRFFPFYSMQSILSGIAPAIEGEKTAKLLKRKV